MITGTGPALSIDGPPVPSTEFIDDHADLVRDTPYERANPA